MFRDDDETKRDPLPENQLIRFWQCECEEAIVICERFEAQAKDLAAELQALAAFFEFNAGEKVKSPKLQEAHAKLLDLLSRVQELERSMSRR